MTFLLQYVSKQRRSSAAWLRSRLRLPCPLHLRAAKRHRLPRPPGHSPWLPTRKGRRTGGVPPIPGVIATAQIRQIRRPPSTMPNPCAPMDSARKPWPSSNRHQSVIRSTGACLAPMAARLLTWGISSRRWKCSTTPIRRTSPTGISCPFKARSSTRWEGTRKRKDTTAPRCGLCRTSPRCCRISAFLMPFQRTLSAPRLRCAGRQPRVAVDPRVRQNLALVMGLQGRFAEAENIAQADLPSDEAAANVAYLRAMLAQQNGWKFAWPVRKSAARSRQLTFVARTCALHFMVSMTLIAAGPRITTKSTGRKNRIIGTVSFGGSAAAFFSASDMRMSRFSCAITRSVCAIGVP